jgi:hypothetical protein
LTGRVAMVIKIRLEKTKTILCISCMKQIAGGSRAPRKHMNSNDKVPAVACAGP